VADPFLRHPDLHLAAFTDDHGPAFRSPWLDPADPVDAAVIAATEELIRQARRRWLVARLLAAALDRHDLANLRSRERPGSWQPEQEDG
jgi:hypothetical protein